MYLQFLQVQSSLCSFSSFRNPISSLSLQPFGIQAGKSLANSKVGLDELRLKRMVVSDKSLVLLSRSFVNFKSLVLVSCEGFTTNGLATIAENCRLIGGTLERLVGRSPNLKVLRLNRCSVLADTAILKPKSVTSLSGFLDVPFSLVLMYPICWNLTSLNLSSEAGIQGREMIRIIHKCDKLRCLRIMNCIGDKGLGYASSIQQNLTLSQCSHWMKVSEQSCSHVNDEAAITLRSVDQPGDPLHWNVSAEHLEMLSIEFSGESNKGMLKVLNQCKNLRKLKIRNCPFGNTTFLTDIGKYETMQSLWTSSWKVTVGACKTLTEKMPRLNVVIFIENEQADCYMEDGQRVEKMYLYRTEAGKREDAPKYFV
ncbi:hypothetical protein TSUD_250150 [Trifolium subterraneum]|nr:hypothetical protein TSUD_250150 [Trifolium subterraneum]